jgi:hypothetical protein
VGASMRNKVLDLRTARGMRIFEIMCVYYPSMVYGPDQQTIYSEGYTHVIDTYGNVLRCKPE